MAIAKNVKFQLSKVGIISFKTDLKVYLGSDKIINTIRGGVGQGEKAFGGEFGRPRAARKENL